MDRSAFIRGLLDDPRDPQLPQSVYGSGVDFNPLMDMVAGMAVQPYSNEPGRRLSSAPGRMHAAMVGFPGFAKDMAQGSINSAVRGVKTAHKAWPGLLGGEGAFDPNDPEDFAGAQDLAGLMSGGAIPFESPAGALRMGASAGTKASKAAAAAAKAEKEAATRASIESKAPGLLGAADEAAANTKTLRGRTAYGPEQDLMFRGKSPHDFEPADWGAFGAHYGVPNMGPSSNEAWQASLVPYRTTTGREFTIPGGVDGRDPFSYYDMLHLKSQGIDPNELTDDIRIPLHNRMVGSMEIGPNAPDEAIFNRWLMGLLSPNNPLTPNEFAVASLSAKTRSANPKANMGDIDRLASQTPWGLDNAPPKEAQRAVRNVMSKEISAKYGLQAASRGGLGASGSVDYTRVADFAKMFKEHPEFFRFRGTGEGGMDDAGNWLNFVSRVASQVPGLSAKTGSFGGGWQNPSDAAISAIDRHMATQFNDDLFANAKEKAAFEKSVVKMFNAGKPRKEQIKDFAGVMEAPGGRGAYVEQVMNHVNKHGSAKYRTAKGEINPNVPEAMQGVDFVREPEQVIKLSPGYLRGLQANQAVSKQNGQGIFNSQWMLWDKIRQRIEPHEIMYPGLESIPRMSQAQHRAALDVHRKAGYLTSPSQVQTVQTPSSLAYFTMGGPWGGLLGSGQNDQ